MVEKAEMMQSLESFDACHKAFLSQSQEIQTLLGMVKILKIKLLKIDRCLSTAIKVV